MVVILIVVIAMVIMVVILMVVVIAVIPTRELQNDSISYSKEHSETEL